MKKMKSICAIILAAMMLVGNISGYAAEVIGSEIYLYDWTIDDTYEEEESKQAIPVSGTFQDSLTPAGGSASILRQSDSVVITYPKSTGNKTDYLTKFNIPLNKEKKVDVIAFDLFIPNAANFGFSSALGTSGNQTEREQFLISSKGKIYAAYNLDVQSDMTWWFNTYASSTTPHSGGLADTPANFTFGQWHSISLVSDESNHYLYLDGVKVGSVSNKSARGRETFEIQNYSQNQIPCYIDNFKVGNLDSFDAPSSLSDTTFADAVYAVDETYSDENLELAVSDFKPGIAVTGDRVTEGTWTRKEVTGADAKIAKQSDAAIVYGSATAKADNKNYELRFKNSSVRTANGSWPTNALSWPSEASAPIAVISFDINVFKNANMVFATLTNSWQRGYDIVVSENGYITHTTYKDNTNWNNFSSIVSLTKEQAEAAGYATASFEANQWHNIKFIYNGGTNGHKCYLYCDETYVGEVSLDPWYNFSYMDITYFSALASGEAMFEIDNLKMGNAVIRQGFAVNDAAIVDGNGNTVTNYTAGETYFVKFDAENYTTIPKDLMLVIAQYGDDILEEVKVHKQPLGIADAVLFDHASGDNAISFVANSSAKKIGLLVWETMTLKPLKDAVYALKSN